MPINISGYRCLQRDYLAGIVSKVNTSPQKQLNCARLETLQHMVDVWRPFCSATMAAGEIAADDYACAYCRHSHMMEVLPELKVEVVQHLMADHLGGTDAGDRVSQPIVSSIGVVEQLALEQATVATKDAKLKPFPEQEQEQPHSELHEPYEPQPQSELVPVHTLQGLLTAAKLDKYAGPIEEQEYVNLDDLLLASEEELQELISTLKMAAPAARRFRRALAASSPGSVVSNEGPQDKVATVDPVTCVHPEQHANAEHTNNRAEKNANKIAERKQVRNGRLDAVWSMVEQLALEQANVATKDADHHGNRTENKIATVDPVTSSHQEQQANAKRASKIKKQTGDGRSRARKLLKELMGTREDLLDFEELNKTFACHASHILRCKHYDNTILKLRLMLQEQQRNSVPCAIVAGKLKNLLKNNDRLQMASGQIRQIHKHVCALQKQLQKKSTTGVGNAVSAYYCTVCSECQGYCCCCASLHLTAVLWIVFM